MIHTKVGWTKSLSLTVPKGFGRGLAHTPYFNSLLYYSHWWTDGNGNIDFNEILELMQRSMQNQSIEEKIRGLFDAIDAGGDGCITEDDITSMMDRLGEKVKKKEIREMLRAAGASEDGKISFPEFKMMVERFMKSREFTFIVEHGTSKS